MSFEVKGIKGMQQRIDRIVRQVPNEAEQALRIEAEVIMTKSKQGYVPVDLGPLRASGHVSDPERRGKDVEVTLSFGGAAAPYALAVHEHPGDYDPPSWEGKGTSFVKGDGNSDVVHFGPGERGPKYLERPLRAAVAGMAERIAAKIEAGLAGLLLLGLLALPAAAQVSGISVRAFGAKAWREGVASVAALPTSGNTLGDLRFVRDTETLYWWTGSAWSSLEGLTGPQGPQGATGATGATGAAGAAGADGTPRDIADEGTTLTRRAVLNFTGSGVSCSDNSGASRTDCTVAGGGGSGTIGGTVGAADNAITRADGTGSVTAQGSLASIDDSGNLIIPDSARIYGLGVASGSWRIEMSSNAGASMGSPLNNYPARTIATGYAILAVHGPSAGQGFVVSNGGIGQAEFEVGSGPTGTEALIDGKLTLNKGIRTLGLSSPPWPCDATGDGSSYKDNTGAGTMCDCINGTGWINRYPLQAGADCS